MRKYLKRIFLSVSVFIALMSFSCQSNLSEFVDNEDIVFSALSRSVKNSVEKGVVYPKGVIPQWVKDSLSEEGYALVCQLSRKYEMTYYPLSLKGKERMSLRNENTNQRTIDVLLSIPEEQLNYSIEENLIDMNVPRLKVLNAESEGDGWDGEPELLELYIRHQRRQRALHESPGRAGGMGRGCHVSRLRDDPGDAARPICHGGYPVGQGHQRAGVLRPRLE